MATLSLFIVATAVAIAGWSFGSRWSQQSAGEAQRDRTPEPSVAVDAEFDAEFNALLRDMSSVESSTSLELKGIESEE
jgi:hypothetical protein